MTTTKENGLKQPPRPRASRPVAREAAPLAPLSPTAPTFPIAPTFEETFAALRVRAEASEGNFRQAFLLLSAAEQLHRQASQYESQRDAIKASPTGGNRKGIRLSHLQHSITRTLKSRDRYIDEAAVALDATTLDATAE